MVDDDGLDDLVDMSLAGDLVLAVRCGHECGAKAYGQVVWVHHVLITVLGKAREMRKGCEQLTKEQLRKETKHGAVFPIKSQLSNC